MGMSIPRNMDGLAEAIVQKEIPNNVFPV